MQSKSNKFFKLNSSQYVTLENEPDAVVQQFRLYSRSKTRNEKHASVRSFKERVHKQSSSDLLVLDLSHLPINYAFVRGKLFDTIGE